MIQKSISYDTVLCASRHEILSPQGNKVLNSVFPEVCSLNIKELDNYAVKYFSDFKKSIKPLNYKDIILNVYVTGFSPALVSLINMHNVYFKEINLILWHYDLRTKAYIPQKVLL